MILLLPFLLTLAASPLWAATLTISWTERTEADLVGYSVYIGTAQGQYGSPTRVTRPPYTATVEGGKTYYVWVAAVDALNQEGRKSNFTLISVPPDPPPTLPAPTWVAPPQRLTTLPGDYTLRWSAIPGAVRYELYVHEQGTPYPDDDPMACAAMPWCGAIAGTELTIRLEPNTAYDMWIHSLDAAGVRGRSAGALLTVLDTPPPPPPEPEPTPSPEPPTPPHADVALRHALRTAIAHCLADTRRSLMKCFTALQAELLKVHP